MTIRFRILSFAIASILLAVTAHAQNAKYPDCYPLESNGKSKLANLMAKPSYAAQFEATAAQLVRANEASKNALTKLDAQIAETSSRVARLTRSGPASEAQAAEASLSDLQKRRREVADYVSNILKPTWKKLTGCSSEVMALAQK